MEKPGFLDLRLKAKVKDKIYDHHCKEGFSPELTRTIHKKSRRF